MENIVTVLDSILLKINEFKAKKHESKERKKVEKSLLSSMIQTIESSLQWEEMKAENQKSGISIENSFLDETSVFNGYSPINIIEVRQSIEVLKKALNS